MNIPSDVYGDFVFPDQKTYSPHGDTHQVDIFYEIARSIHQLAFEQTMNDSTGVPFLVDPYVSLRTNIAQVTRDYYMYCIKFNNLMVIGRGRNPKSLTVKADLIVKYNPSDDRNVQVYMELENNIHDRDFNGKYMLNCYELLLNQSISHEHMQNLLKIWLSVQRHSRMIQDIQRDWDGRKESYKKHFIVPSHEQETAIAMSSHARLGNMTMGLVRDGFGMQEIFQLIFTQYDEAFIHDLMLPLIRD